MGDVIDFKEFRDKKLRERPINIVGIDDNGKPWVMRNVKLENIKYLIEGGDDEDTRA